MAKTPCVLYIQDGFCYGAYSSGYAYTPRKEHIIFRVPMDTEASAFKVSIDGIDMEAPNLLGDAAWAWLDALISDLGYFPIKVRR